MTRLVDSVRSYISSREARAATRAKEKWILARKLTDFEIHNRPLLFRGRPLAEAVFTPQQLEGEFTALQLGFSELGEGAIENTIEALVGSGFILDPDGVYKDFKRKRREGSSYTLNLNGVFELIVNVIDDSLGSATYITIAPCGEVLPDSLDG